MILVIYEQYIYTAYIFGKKTMTASMSSVSFAILNTVKYQINELAEEVLFFTSYREF